MSHTHSSELFNGKDEWNYVVCKKIDGTVNHHIKWNKPD
jgi:hypothetical protein